jgi:hypothetical protein
METSKTTRMESAKKVSFGSFMGKQAVILFLSLCSMPMAMAQGQDINTAEVSAKPSVAPVVVAVDVVKKPTQAETDVKIAAQSIINMMSMMQSSAPQRASVKVPSYNYLPILQELQNRNAKFLLPGAAVPTDAHIVFLLVSEQAGMSQTVYF